MELVVELVVELADWLVVGLVAQLIVYLVVELVVKLVVELVVGLVGGLVSRLVDEAVGSGLAAVLRVDCKLSAVQRLQDAVHVKAESEGVCWQRNTQGQRGKGLSSSVKFSKYSQVLTKKKCLCALYFPP